MGRSICQLMQVDYIKLSDFFENVVSLSKLNISTFTFSAYFFKTMFDEAVPRR
jgi:hypothetical protein